MKKLILLITALIGFFSSCQEKDPDDPLYDNNYFPNTGGLVWNYERYDSLQNKLDTVIVSITGDSLISGNTWKIWEYMYNDATDTIFVRQDFDSVFIFDPSAVLIVQIYYIPFELGQGWFNPEYYNDTSYVAGIEDIVIDEMTFHDVFLIHRKVSGQNYILRERIWYKPQLGLVQLERNEFNTMHAKNESWKLIKTQRN